MYNGGNLTSGNLLGIVSLTANSDYEATELKNLSAELTGTKDIAFTFSGGVYIRTFIFGTEDSEKYNDSIFEQAFGANYVNLRRELASEECVKKFVTDITNEDCMMMDMGRIPDCLRIDEIHLNRMGYKVAAMIISEKMKELYYIE